MGLISEFREFAMRGNVIDLAVGVVIGAAFGKIVSSLVNDVVMPVIGKLAGGVNFSELALVLSPAQMVDGKEVAAAVLLRYGAFLQSIMDFTLIALIVFLAIRLINRLQRPRIAPVVVPSDEVLLLVEIRDLLKSR